MNKVKKILNNQRGAFSILMVILGLIAILIVSYLLDQTEKTYIMNEVQGIMDTAATNSLTQILSTNHLKEELFGFSESTISKNDSATDYTIPAGVSTRLMDLYEKQLTDYIGRNNYILEFNVDRANTTFRFAKGTWGLGSTTKARPFLVLDSVVQVRVRQSSLFDHTSSYNNKVVDRLNGGTFVVTSIGSPAPGETLLTIRTVARAVFR